MNRALYIMTSYQRLVKTTPKPRATKNSNGELVGPLPPPLLEPALVVADGAADEVVEDMTTLCYARSYGNGIDLEHLSAGEVENDSGLPI